jgi:hypothetical protein
MKIKYLTVHASGTPASENLRLRDIDIEDRRRGFASCGYHYVIRRNGEIEEGRRLGAPSIHENHLADCCTSVSVCLIGGADSEGGPEDNFTPEQRKALVTLHRERHPDLGVKYVHPSLTD